MSLARSCLVVREAEASLAAGRSQTASSSLSPRFPRPLNIPLFPSFSFFPKHDPHPAAKQPGTYISYLPSSTHTSPSTHPAPRPAPLPSHSSPTHHIPATALTTCPPFLFLPLVAMCAAHDDSLTLLASDVLPPVFKLTALLATGYAVHRSLSPPNPPPAPKTCIDNRTLFERAIRHVTFCSKVSSMYALCYAHPLSLSRPERPQLGDVGPWFPASNFAHVAPAVRTVSRAAPSSRHAARRSD